MVRDASRETGLSSVESAEAETSAGAPGSFEECQLRESFLDAQASSSAEEPEESTTASVIAVDIDDIDEDGQGGDEESTSASAVPATASMPTAATEATRRAEAVSTVQETSEGDDELTVADPHPPAVDAIGSPSGLPASMTPSVSEGASGDEAASSADGAVGDAEEEDGEDKEVFADAAAESSDESPVVEAAAAAAVTRRDEVVSTPEDTSKEEAEEEETDKEPSVGDESGADTADRADEYAVAPLTVAAAAVATVENGEGEREGEAEVDDVERVDLAAEDHAPPPSISSDTSCETELAGVEFVEEEATGGLDASMEELDESSPFLEDEDEAVASIATATATLTTTTEGGDAGGAVPARLSVTAMTASPQTSSEAERGEDVLSVQEENPEEEKEVAAETAATASAVAETVDELPAGEATPVAGGAVSSREEASKDEEAEERAEEEEDEDAADEADELLTAAAAVVVVADEVEVGAESTSSQEDRASPPATATEAPAEGGVSGAAVAGGEAAACAEVSAEERSESSTNESNPFLPEEESKDTTAAAVPASAAPAAPATQAAEKDDMGIALSRPAATAMGVTAGASAPSASAEEAVAASSGKSLPEQNEEGSPKNDGDVAATAVVAVDGVVAMADGPPATAAPVETDVDTTLARAPEGGLSEVESAASEAACSPTTLQQEVSDPFSSEQEEKCVTRTNAKGTSPATLAAPKTSPRPTPAAAQRVRARAGAPGEKSSGGVLVVTAAAATAYKTGDSPAVPKPAAGTARSSGGGVSSYGEAMAEEHDETLVVNAAAGAAAVANELAVAMAAGVGMEVPEEEVAGTETTPGLATRGRMSSRLSVAADSPSGTRLSEAEAPAGEATAEREATMGARAADGEKKVRLSSSGSGREGVGGKGTGGTAEVTVANVGAEGAYQLFFSLVGSAFTQL
ncbi:unnamed protein product [Scytosiphon promiscuus]